MKEGETQSFLDATVTLNFCHWKIAICVFRFVSYRHAWWTKRRCESDSLKFVGCFWTSGESCWSLLQRLLETAKRRGSDRLSPFTYLPSASKLLRKYATRCQKDRFLVSRQRHLRFSGNLCVLRYGCRERRYLSSARRGNLYSFQSVAKPVVTRQAWKK